jgi:myo-inositol-1-phosphate synthase
MSKIRVAIAGVGNCASSLIQGLQYYKDIDEKSPLIPGLVNNVVGGYKISDIEPVVAFDIDHRKVGKDLSKAIFAKPNCTMEFSEVPYLDAPVFRAPVMDGVSQHMNDFPEDDSFSISSHDSVDVAEMLELYKVDVLVNYLPVGSAEASKYYAECCLEAGCCFVNGIPEFIVSTDEYDEKFKEAKLSAIGDDWRSQYGATQMNAVLVKSMHERGIAIDKLVQDNWGGNTDFINMLISSRLKTKKISKTEAITSTLPYDVDDVKIGPSGLVSDLKDTKVAKIIIEGRKFGNVPIKVEAKLYVEDSPNSAGVAVDAIRCVKLAHDRGEYGSLVIPSGAFCKHPIKQINPLECMDLLHNWIDMQ